MDEQAVNLRMRSAVDVFIGEIASIRTGRANPGLIEGVKVAVYDGQQQLTLRELGAIEVPDARHLVFKPWDVSIIAEIKNGLDQANLGFTLAVDGNLIRASLPALTSEQREDYVKILQRKAEAGRVMIRNTRADVRHDLQERLKRKEISEDEFYRQEKKLQDLTDEHIADIEKRVAKKEKEIRGE